MKTENELNSQLEQYQHFLNISIDDQSYLSCHHNINDQKSLFLLMIVEYLNNNFTQLKYAMKEEVDCLIKKNELTNSFLLNTINEEFLKMSIEDIIITLESLSPIIAQRKCFSFNNNPVKAHKLLFDLNRVFYQFNKEEKKQFKKDIVLENTKNILGLSIEKKKDITNISLEKTPNFGKPHSTKMMLAKGRIQSKENKGVPLFRSPSPVILHKAKTRNDKKKTYETPDKNKKKNFWLY